MYQSIIENCVAIAIEKQACNIINEYIEYWPNGTKFEKYKIEHLDSKFYYLIYLHCNDLADIFHYDNSLFRTLFLII